MAKVFALITGLLLFSSFLFSQIENIEDQPLDSIILWMEHNYVKDSNDFHQIGLRTLNKASKSANDLQLAKLNEHMASWHGYHGFFAQDSVINYDKKALEHYINLNDSQGIANTYKNLSLDLLNNSAFDESQTALFKAIEIYELLEDEAGLAKAHKTMAALHERLKDPEAAIKYGNLALDYSEDAEDYYLSATTLLIMIQSFNQAGRYQEAQEAAVKCLRIVDDYIPDEIGILVRALAYKADVSIKENNLAQALEESTRAYDIVVEAVGTDRAGSYRLGIADILSKQGRHQEAIVHYKASIVSFEEQIVFLHNVYQKLSTSYQNLGDYKNAFLYLEKYTNSLVQIHNDKITNLETEAVIKYETGKKDQAILAQEIEIKQKNRIQLLGIGTLALLLIFLGTLYWNYRKNQKITEALRIKNEENEFLMKEIHHRVKNNLQILSSLLSLQSNYIKDTKASDAIKEGRNRVESMGMIHQRLYTQDHRAAINLKEYIPDLCAFLSDSFLSEERNIQISADIEVDLVDVETAIPLGLVINELITNSIKYAFDDLEKGEIRIKTWLNDNGQLCLHVKDNGQGSNGITDLSRATNFGSELVNVLIKKLKGSLEQNTENGYSTIIIFDRFKLIPQH